MLRIAIFTVTLLVSIGASKAATILTAPWRNSGRFVVLVEGDILLNDYERFRQTVSTISKALVLFRSDGGNAIAGIQIGRLIRMKNFATLVPDDMRCASACALAWLGGARRFMGANAHIGFHAAYDPTSGQESGSGNAVVGAYLNEIGLPYPAVAYITSAAPTSINWLTRIDAQRFGIDVSVLDSPRAEVSTKPALGNRVSELQQRSRAFVTSLYNVISGFSDDIALNNLYADSVRYYGKEMSREQVIAETHRFLARWPIREYKPKENSITIDCNGELLICTVKGEVEFDAQSPSRDRHSSGTARFEYALRFTSPDPLIPQIIVEAGTVLKRDMRPLIHETDGSLWGRLYPK